MRTSLWTGAAMLAAVLGAGGCGPGPGQAVRIDHASPRLLAVSLHEAVAQKDYNAVVESMEGDYRGQYKAMIAAARRYIDALNSLADLVDRRIGPGKGQRCRKLAADVYAGMAPSPLEGAVDGGKIDWGKVNLLDEGDMTSVMISGHPTEFDRQYVVVQSRGGWYVMPRLKDVPLARRKSVYTRESRYVQGRFDDYVKLVKDLAGRIGGGSINADNFEDKISALVGQAASQPAPAP